MKNQHPTLKNLIGCERGNVLMTFGLTSLIAVAAVGGSVDFGRSYQMKSKMQNALDSAVTSGIAKYREFGDWGSAKTHAAAVFQAVFSNAVSPVPGQPAPTAGLDQPVVSFSQSGTQLVGTATMRANTPFMNMIIGENMQMAATSSATPATGKMIELAVMVDLTGSMGWSAVAGASTTGCNAVGSPSSKIDYLKCAYEDLLNIMLPTSGVNNSTVRVGVAPFADYVNAGTYASAVTGLASEGGTYANISNLASTRQRSSFSGTYSGYTAGSGTANQYGSMGTSAPSGATTSTAGAVYTNGYCANPTYTGLYKYSDVIVGESVSLDGNSNSQWSGDPPAGMLRASVNPYYDISNYNGSWHLNNSPSSDNHKYYVPAVSNTSGLTVQQHSANVESGYWVDPPGYNNKYYVDTSSLKTGDRGERISVVSDATPPSWVKKASDGPDGGFWDVKEIKTDGSLEYEWKTSGYYLPLYTADSLTAAIGGTVSGCESAVVAQPSSKLISCVTERMNGNALDFTDDAPATSRYIGAYNHGDTSKSNYSSDGKCMVAGRELPSVIPLTNNRDTLEDFIDNATVGGATPGHLGTAWAQYLLSPDWSSVWPSDSIPAAYSNTGVKKAAILMTDGEYNLQFSMAGSSSNISAKQALMLCKQMRDNGVHVYTVGFGFAENATPPTTNIEGLSDADRTTPAGTDAKSRALDVLAKCASTNSSYKFPYDGASLRQAFKDIANGLTADANGGKARLTQ